MPAQTVLPAAWVLGSAVLTLAADQATKSLAVDRLGSSREPARRGGVFRPVLNRRGCGGATARWPGLLALWVLEVGTVLWLVQAPFLEVGVAAQVALGAALGGAAGNLLDRIRRGGVVDFIDLRVWPVFNMADAAIVAGAALAMLSMV